MGSKNAAIYKTFILLTLLLCAVPSTGFSRDSMHAEIIVSEDSSVTVKETIHIESGDAWFRNEFDRNLPTARNTLLGLKNPNGFQLLECLRDGRPETWKIFGGDGLLLRIGNFMNSNPIPQVRNYTLKYRLQGQIISSGEEDRFNWTVTDKYWGWWPIDVSASVSLPGDAAAHIKDLRMEITGREGQTEAAPSGASISGGAVYFSAPGPLDQNEELAISLAWPKGYLRKSPTSSIVRQLSAANKEILIGLGGLGVLFGYYLIVWMILGRGPAEGTMVTRYDPPRGLSPAVIRYIWKMGYDDRCLTAALLNMASKGHLKIWDDKDGQYVVTKKEGKFPLSEDELKIMQQLLPTGGEIRLETEDRRLPAAVSVFSVYLQSNHEKISFISNSRYFGVGLLLSALLVVATGLGALTDPLDMVFFMLASVVVTVFSPPFILFLLESIKRWRAAFAHGGARGVRIFKAVIFTIAASFYFSYAYEMLSAMSSMTTPYFIAFIAAAVLINCVFYQILRAPTLAGRKLYDEIGGFREFLMMTEKDRLNLLNPPDRTPELFTRYLPYALALDVEQEWAENFSSLLGGAALAEEGSSPDWAQGNILSIVGRLLKSP